MKLRFVFITALLTAFIVGTASAVTINQSRIGPLVISTVGGQVIQAAFTNAFRGSLIPVVGTGLALYEVAKIIKIAYDATQSDNIVPGVNNSTIPTPHGWSDPNTPPGSLPANVNTQPLQSYCDSQFGGYCPVLSPYGPSYLCKGESGNTCGDVPDNLIQATCPTGYTLANGLCNLSQSSDVKWPSDGQSTITQQPDGTFKAHPRDPDSPAGNIDGQTTVTQNGQDEFGNTVQQTYKSTPDGGMDVIRRLETKNEQGQNVVQEDTTHFDSTGQVTQSFQNTYNNTTINNIDQNSNGGSTQTIDVSGLNQEATQQQVLQQLKDLNAKQTQNPTTPQITVSGNGGKIPPFDKTAPTLNESMERLKNGIYNLPFLGPLVQASQTNYTPSAGPCPLVLHVEITPFSFPWVLHTDVMCQLMETINPVLEMVMTFIFLTAGFYIIMSA